MAGDGGGGGLDGEVGWEASLVVCECPGPTIAPRLLVSAETCVSARAGVDNYCRGSRFFASLEKELDNEMTMRSEYSFCPPNQIGTSLDFSTAACTGATSFSKLHVHM